MRAWTGRLRRKAVLDVGELALVPGVPCGLDAGGFDRHTFLCGQSGSGKTYSLGVVLERLLLSTGLRIIVLDPNSDFARIGSVRDGTDPATADAYRAATASIAVHSARATGEQRLRIRLGEIGAATQAALLRLDPIADADEHAELTRLLDEGRMPTADEVQAAESPGARALHQRARNLGISELGVWAREQPGSTLDALHDESLRGVVVDLGSLPTAEEQALVAEAVLGELWRRREERRPVLIVIDEAHNVCPAEPANPILALATEHAVRIAAEGRKFGLYMLVSTQRPQKVHENVITQCDNLLLMRLNSAADARFAQSVFSFVPPRLVDQAPVVPARGGARGRQALAAARRCCASARGSARRAAPTSPRRGRAAADGRPPRRGARRGRGRHAHRAGRRPADAAPGAARAARARARRRGAPPRGRAGRERRAGAHARARRAARERGARPPDLRHPRAPAHGAARRARSSPPPASSGSSCRCSRAA